MVKISEKDLREIEQACVKLLATAGFNFTHDEIKQMHYENDNVPTFTLRWADGQAIRITVKAEDISGEGVPNG